MSDLGRRMEINASPDMEASYPDSVSSSPRSRDTESDYFGGSSNQRWEAVDTGASSTSPSARVRLMCSSGGKILPRPHDNQLAYVGGDTRILAVDRSIKFSTMISKLSNLWGSGVSFKYQLPNEDLDALVSVTNDEDLDNMMAEYDRLQKSGYKCSRLRLFVFPNKPAEGSTSSLGSVLEEKREQWFVEALNNPPVNQGNTNRSDTGSISEASAWVNNMPDYLFGLGNTSVGTGTNNNGGVEEDRKQALPELQSSQKSIDSDASRLGDTQIGINPVSEQVEKGGGNLNWGFEDNSSNNLLVNSSPVQEIGIPVPPNTNLQRQQQQQEDYTNPNLQRQRQQQQEEYMNLNLQRRQQQQQEEYMNPNLQRQQQEEYMNPDLQRQQQEEYMNPNLQRQQQQEEEYMNPNLQRQQQQQEEYMNPNLQRQRQQEQEEYMKPNLQRQQQQEGYMNPNLRRRQQQQEDYMNPNLQRLRQQQQEEVYMQELSASTDAANRRQQDVNFSDVINRRPPAQQQQQQPPPQFPVQKFQNLNLKQQQDSIPRTVEDTNMNLPGRKMYSDPVRAMNLPGPGQEIYMQQTPQAQNQTDYYRQDQQQATGHPGDTYWQMHDQGGNSQYPVYLVPAGSNMLQTMSALRPSPGYYNPVQRVNAAPAVYDAPVTTVRPTARLVQGQQQQVGGVSDVAADPYREQQQAVLPMQTPTVSKVTPAYGVPVPLPMAGDVRMIYRATAPVTSVPLPHPESYSYAQQQVVYDPNMNPTRQVYYTQAVNPQYPPMGPVTTDVHVSSSLEMTTAAAAAAAAASEQQVKLARVSQASS